MNEKASSSASSDPVRVPNLADQKLGLEIKKLNQEMDWVGRFSARIWPLIATLLTIVLSGIAIIVSFRTQQKQASLQTELAHEQLTFNSSVHHDEFLRAALSFATDNSGDSDRRIAGIWQLNSAWSNPDDFELAASTLTAELGLPDKFGPARCAAAEVIGNAMNQVSPDNRLRLASLLFGDASGAWGLVTRENVVLKESGQSNIQSPLEPCKTALDSTREAIRKNWTYLRKRDFAFTDLQGIQLYQADLAGSIFYKANISNSNLRCANLNNVNLENAIGKDSADFLYSNVKTSTDPMMEILFQKGVVFKLDDSDWIRWRSNGMRVDGHNKPILSGSDGVPLDCVSGDVNAWHRLLASRYTKWK